MMSFSKKPKILLINPPGELKNSVLPLGLASIAAYLRNSNVDVLAIDALAEELSFEQLENRVSESQADIIGIYVTSPRYGEGKNACETCRKALPDSVIIAGGPHPSALPIETLQEIPQLDICGIGEGEITMLELVKAIENNTPLSQVNGIAFREKKDGQIIITKPRDFIKNLDDLPFPARDLFPLEKYKTLPPYGRKNPYFTTITSRGCPFNCAYCSKDVFRNIFRARSPKNVADEIEELIHKYRAQEIQFYDDDFTLDMKRAEEICDEILRRGIKIRWSCLTRVDLVNKNLLNKIKKAGCWMIAYGVESGNQKILDAMGRGINAKQVISAFEMSREAGLTTSAGFIAGLPGETRETIQDTLNLAKKINPDFFSYGILVIYPGSRFFKLIKNGEHLGRLRNVKNEEVPGTYPRKGNFVIIENDLTLEELSDIIKKANLKFYLRFRCIIQSLKSMRSFSDFQYYFRGLINIIKSAI